MEKKNSMDEDCLNASSKRRRESIEETVSQILNTTDLDKATELAVRAAAAERLGVDLSGLAHRRLVRQLMESFLLSNATVILASKPSDKINTHFNNSNARNAKQKQLTGGGRVSAQVNYDGKIICKLAEKRMVTVHDFHGAKMVSIRDFYVKDGNMLPNKGINSGLSLPAKQWSTFRNSVPAIQEAIAKLESQLRSEPAAKQCKTIMANSVENSAAERNQTLSDIFNPTRAYNPHNRQKQTEADASNSVIAEIKQEAATAGICGSNAISNSQEQIPAKRRQLGTNISLSVPAFPAQAHWPTIDALCPDLLVPAEGIQTGADSTPDFPNQSITVHTVRPERLIPIQPTRLDGRNYHSWGHQMEFFLNQLNISYVLAEPCPSTDDKVKVKTPVQRWIDDDYLCRHHILNSLSDNLFQIYSQKSYSARELWDELKLAYADDFGTKRSQINKYIHFQMVEGVSVLEQAQELHRIATSIMASGTWMDENFHVSVIISKLPPSWKEFRARLMHDDFMPLNMLMHRVQVEEDSRKCNKKETDEKGRVMDCSSGMRRNENKRACYNCSKEGHISKYCPDRKYGEKSNVMENAISSPETIKAAKTK